MPQLSAVLTGDLIGSSQAEIARVDRSMALLAEAAAQVTQSNRFTRYRGDGWQVVLAKPRHFLSTAVYMHARLKGDPDCLPTRISIGLGTVDSLGDEAGLGAASGKAFLVSGRALDDKGATLGHSLILSGEATDDIQRAVLAFVEDRIKRWSREQAEVVALKLTPGKDYTQDQIAEVLGITRQAVAARLQAAGWRLIRQACAAFDTRFAEGAP